LFSRGLESFKSSFGYKVKLVSKLPIFFDKVKTFDTIFEKQFLTAYGKFSLGF
jgi:hypothetical protein